VVVAGEVNYESAPRIVQSLRELQEKGELRIAMDCGSVDFIDSSGIGAIVHAADALRRAGGALSLRAATPQLTHALQVSGFSELLDVQAPAPEQAAVRARRGHPSRVWQQARFSVGMAADEEAVARRRVTELAEMLPFSPEQIDDIRLAVGEAVANAIRHGCAGRDGHLTVRCAADSEKLVIRVHNPGEPFDPAAVPVPNPCSLREGGLGIFFMRTAMDSVDYSFDDTGTTVTMTKYLPPAEEGDGRRSDHLD